MGQNQQPCLLKMEDRGKREERRGTIGGARILAIENFITPEQTNGLARAQGL